MFTDSHCHIEDDETAFRAGAVGVGVILNAGKDLDEATAQLQMCERMDRLRAEPARGGYGRIERRCGRVERCRAEWR